jgi:cobalt/nickel transport protein
MNRFKWLFVAVLMALVPLEFAQAHFGMAIVSDNMVMQNDERTIEVTLSFSHPFEMVGMPLEKPDRFFVVKDGKKVDLKPQLVETMVMEQKAFKAEYKIKRPGSHTFVMQPEPYWENAEDCFIVHYTKTIVAAFGSDEGWDAESGLKTEIVPLSRPFGLYAGNVFQGIVKIDGRPVPYSTVEIEYYNEVKKVTAPSDYMITQVVKADGNGVFTYAAPFPGWWGFSAVNRSDEKMMRDNEEKDVEIGAVLWVKFESVREN